MEIIYANEVQAWASVFEPNEFAELNRLIQVLRQPFPDSQAIIATHWQPRLVATAEFVTGSHNLSKEICVLKFFFGFVIYLFFGGLCVVFILNVLIVFVF